MVWDRPAAGRWLVCLLALLLLTASWPFRAGPAMAVPLADADGNAVPGLAADDGKGRRDAADRRRERAGKQRDRQRDGRSRTGERGGKVEIGRLPDAADREAPKLPAYNVLFAADVEDAAALAETLIAAFGVSPTHVFHHAVKGFAGRMEASAAAELARDPRVAIVSAVQVYRPGEATRPVRMDRVGAERSQRAATGASDLSLPPNIKRIGADLNPVADIDGVDDIRVDADVMVIDTGVARHPDLNVVRQIDFTGEGHDEEDHGTWVAGVIGARDDGVGAVGVAPGVRIWSADVQGSRGIPDSNIIDALDAATDPKNGIEVVNISLATGRGPTTCAADAYHAAVCEVVKAGVTVVVSAGQGTYLDEPGRDAKNTVPANFQEAIAVSAMADSDGAPGALGPPVTTPYGTYQDDSFAPFSNYGQVIDLAAPGVLVLTTTPDGEYGRGTGTSFAAPHVAGAAALFMAGNPAAKPEQVRQALLANRERVSLSGDPDGVDEGVLNVARLNDPPPVDTTPPSVRLTAPAGAAVARTFTMRAAATDDHGLHAVEFFACSPKCKKVGSDDAAPYLAKVTLLGSAKRATLYARAIDTAGNAAESARKAVRIR